MKLKRWEYKEAGQAGYSFYCPGCKCGHTILTEGHEVWTVTGELERPVIHPSVKVTWPANPEADEDFKEWRTERICHSYVGINGAAPRTDYFP